MQPVQTALKFRGSHMKITREVPELLHFHQDSQDDQINKCYIFRSVKAKL